MMPTIHWSEMDQKFWIATDDGPLWFESSLDANDAARQLAIDAAVKAERDRIVAWLRLENGRCDCHALMAGECACGAWDDDKQWSLAYTADRIEAGDHLK